MDDVTTNSSFQSQCEVISVHVWWHQDDALGLGAASFLFRGLLRDYLNIWKHPVNIPVYFHPLLDTPDETFLVPKTNDLQIHVILVSQALMENMAAYLLQFQKLEQMESDRLKILPTCLYDFQPAIPTMLHWPLLFCPQGPAIGSKHVHLGLHVAYLAIQSMQRIGNLHPTRKLRVHLSYDRLDETDALLGKIWDGLRKLSIDNPTYKDILEVIDDDPTFTYPMDVAMILILTDGFSANHNCRNVVWKAKKAFCPILVIDALANGTDRLLTTIGNVPIIRWEDKRTSAAIVMMHLFINHLRHLWHLHRNTCLKPLCPAGTVPLADHPEHVQMSEIISLPNSSDTRYFLIPDPPMAKSEVDPFLNIDAAIKFLTPIDIHAASTTEMVQVSPKPNQEALQIAIFISELDPHTIEGLRHNDALRDAMNEIGRHLLHEGHRLHYGGRLDYLGPQLNNVADKLPPHNFVLVMDELVKEYWRGDEQEFKPVTNYLPWPFHMRIAEDVMAMHRRFAEVIELPRPNNSGLPDVEVILAKEDTVAKRWVTCLSLNASRQRMAGATDVCIILGGKLYGYTGCMPGVLEEALTMLDAGKPLYVVGGFGGGGTAIAMAMKGVQHPALSLETQMENNRMLAALFETHPDLKPDYNKIVQRLEAYGQAPNNGLDAAENAALSVSANVEEVVGLILRGLRRLRST